MQQLLHLAHYESADDEAREVEVQYSIPLRFALGLETNLFTLTASEYILLPAVLLDFIRIFRDVKAEIRRNNASSDEQ